MPEWQGSTRRDRLPPDWKKIRTKIWRRDRGLCQVKLPSGRKCLEPASDVDHIRAGDDHSPENLRCICEWHHGKKSGSEGAQAAAANRRRVKQSFRRTEAHPGLM